MKQTFPWIALGIGGIFTLALYFSGATSSDAEYKLPLLLILLMSELGCIITALGAYFGTKEWLANRGKFILLLLAVACAALSATLGYLGIGLWEQVTAAQNV